ncbi:glucose 1,6-bisphosphate synthase [Labeo rohita]|uniref:Glucose 1,6-bisphosphate synthase n=1 Tax=Labeo rohita TaxID=84645 RepID=A0A498MCX4_LABRO|nr:glucose 1,6-bisphosphate synthase [Labeo rohita]
MGSNGDLNANNSQCLSSTGDLVLDKAVSQWMAWDKNPQTRKQLESLVREGRVVELRRRLCSRMTFGTAGLRAEMGAGFACINNLTIIQSTQGMYKYLAKCFPDLKTRGLVVGFDTRAQTSSGCSSERLARLTAAVMLCKDIPVYLFSTYVPTPFVPYAVMKYGAAAGVMITASHNRKEDNGYKVYWHNGAQISSPHDKEILRCIEESTEPWPESWNEDLVESSSLRRDPLEDICCCYMEELNTICFHRELNAKSPLKFVHSSFHGVGHNYVQRAFQQFGFPPPIPVPEQKDPDPDFSTVSCPNPEEGESVLELSLRLAEREEARIVVATDPDADRLAVAEQNDKYGYHISRTAYVLCNDPPTIHRIFSRLRNFGGPGVYPELCGDYCITHIRDVTTGYDSSQPDEKCVLPLSKNSQMVTFTFQNGIVATLRTSGTEPKIKYYTEFCAAPGERDLSSLEKELRKVTTALLEEFLEPDKNNLLRRSV